MTAIQKHMGFKFLRFTWFNLNLLWPKHILYTA